MPRLRQVPRAEAASDVLRMYDRRFGERDPVAKPGTGTGTPGNCWTVFALSPEIFAHAVVGFGVMTARSRVLTAYQRELALLRTGFASGSQFVCSQHAKTARGAGVPGEKIAEISAWASSERFDAADRAILAYTFASASTRGPISPGSKMRLR